ncbi:MAG: hypothetical protein IJ416_04190 [Ruminiclostridium sp.]|nr:hypothetical protein [Ruminiclostridium sp.]
MRKKIKQYAVPAAAVIIFIAVVLWFLTGINSAASASREQQLEAVKRSVENSVTLCYSIEGAYPESLAYLEDNYGMHYDKERYLVHYSCFAANIRPTVTVIEKES